MNDDQNRPQRPITPAVVNKPRSRTMDFPAAIREVINGKKIARLEWPDVRDYGVLKDGWLQILRGDKFHTWKVNDGDLLATDWIVVNEPRVLRN